ncbi:DNA polymerase [Corynebacterium hesseae]|uniref:DNA polymerase n=1 Tax=Corynebacterium hesseae TaxID=2913502 RepID=UPI0030CC48DE
MDFDAWQRSLNRAPLAVDTETTGLDIFSEDFRCRAIQFGHGLEAWVILVDELPVTLDTLKQALDDRELWMQNASYDILVLQQCFGYTVDWDKVTDTKILAHLIDSRSRKEGGVGHSLQDLTHEYIDKEVAEKIKGSMTEMAKDIGVKKSELFASIDCWNEKYLTYAGMDVVLTYALRNILIDKVPEPSRRLIRYEHDVARVCTGMERNGFLLDKDYALELKRKLEQEQELWEAVAYARYGVESVNSTAEVAEVLLEEGVKLTETTPSGAWKVNKEILEPLAEQGNLLAHAVTEAKKAKKWRTSWVEKFLDQADASGYCHANIQPLAARTARMSITGIPAQTLPSSDWTIRRCFIPEPGYKIASCDYQAQELRMLAALSGDENMRKAFAEGADLHQITADASGVERSVGKTVNFAYVYGSGPGNIARTCGISVQKAREVIKGFERSYPRVKELSDRLQYEARRNGCIQTPTGRVLKVDPDKPYAALNYMIQSMSRDVTCRGLLRLEEAGLLEYMRLPIHDEIVLSVPSPSIAEKAAELMALDYKNVHVGTDSDVYGPSWGSGYIKPDDDEYQDYLDTFKEG